MRYFLIIGSVFLVNQNQNNDQNIIAPDLNTTPVVRAFKDNFLVPYVIKDSPTEKIEISYPSGVTVELGNVLVPNLVKYPPKVSWPVRSPHIFHTLVMIDPDAMEVTEVKHWLVGNIPGDDISRGQVIAEYIGSAPPDGSGYHRYVFIVYEQPNGPIEFNEPFSSDQDFSFRAFFHLQRFALRYNLGKPLAGNLYFATFDESVPILRAQLGIL